MFLNSAQPSQSWILIVVQLEDNWPQYLGVVSLCSRRLLFIVFGFSMPLSWDEVHLPTGHVLPVGNRTSCLAADVGRFPWFCLLCYSSVICPIQTLWERFRLSCVYTRQHKHKRKTSQKRC